MNLTCAIVDDEPLALDLLESYVNKTPFLTLKGKYSSAVQAMKELPDKQVDLLFLDIQMPELNGLEFSKMVDAHTRIVFSTAFEQYAIDGYKVNALDYLLKPISYVDFLQAANKAVQWLGSFPCAYCPIRPEMSTDTDSPSIAEGAMNKESSLPIKASRPPIRSTNPSTS